MVLPLLTVLLIGVVNLGLVVREFQILQNAAREGAHYSALVGNQIEAACCPAGDMAVKTALETKIKNRVVSYLAEEGITIAASDVTVNQNYPLNVGGGMTVTGSKITVTYSRATLIAASSWLPLGPVTLKGESFFRNFY
jgi:Flp pilus assembly protein TadG